MDKKAETFTYYHVAVPPTKQVGLHSQDTWELSFVLYGKGERIVGDRTADFESGDVLLIPPDIIHCWYFSPDYTDIRGNIINISLMFPSETIKMLGEIFPPIKNNLSCFLSMSEAISFPQDLKGKICGFLKDMHLASDSRRCLIFMELVFLLFENIERGIKEGGDTRKDPVRERLMAIDAYVACNYTRNLTLGEIAVHIGMNKSSFCAFFKRHRKETFVTFLCRYRLERASYLIKVSSPHVPIKEICYQSGFQSVSHFNHLYRKYFGISPKQTRTEK